MIQAYFTQIKTTIERYAATNFVLDATVNFEIRPGNQGFLHGSINFVDNSRLHFREYLDVMAQAVDKLSYSYHYQDTDNQPVFRYDNAQHKPALPFREHKHIGLKDVVEAPAPTIDDVLAEIVVMKEWV